MGTDFFDFFSTSLDFFLFGTTFDDFDFHERPTGPTRAATPSRAPHNPDGALCVRFGALARAGRGGSFEGSDGFDDRFRRRGGRARFSARDGWGCRCDRCDRCGHCGLCGFCRVFRFFACGFSGSLPLRLVDRGRVAGPRPPLPLLREPRGRREGGPTGEGSFRRGRASRRSRRARWA